MTTHLDKAVAAAHENAVNAWKNLSNSIGCGEQVIAHWKPSLEKLKIVKYLEDNSKESKTMENQELLDTARDLVCGDRQDQYGSPEDCFERMAQKWSATLGVRVSAKQVAIMFIDVKTVREAHKHKDDNLVDIMGNVLCLNRILNSKSNQGEEQ